MAPSPVIVLHEGMAPTTPNDLAELAREGLGSPMTSPGRTCLGGPARASTATWGRPRIVRS
jgi:hypothetical protein